MSRQLGKSMVLHTHDEGFAGAFDCVATLLANLIAVQLRLMVKDVAQDYSMEMGRIAFRRIEA